MEDAHRDVPTYVHGRRLEPLLHEAREKIARPTASEQWVGGQGPRLPDQPRGDIRKEGYQSRKERPLKTMYFPSDFAHSDGGGNGGNGNGHMIDFEGNLVPIQHLPNGHCLCPEGEAARFELTRDGDAVCTSCGFAQRLQAGKTAGIPEYDETAERERRQAERRAEETAQRVGDGGIVTCVEPDVQPGEHACRNCRHVAIDEIYGVSARSSAFSRWFADFKASSCTAPRGIVDDAVRAVGNRVALCEPIRGRPQLFKAAGRSHGLSSKGEEALQAVRATLAAHPDLRDAHAIVAAPIDKFEQLKAALTAAHMRLKRMTIVVREGLGVEAARVSTRGWRLEQLRQLRTTAGEPACHVQTMSEAILENLKSESDDAGGTGDDEFVKNELVNVPLLVRTLECGDAGERDTACVAACERATARHVATCFDKRTGCVRTRAPRRFCCKRAACKEAMCIELSGLASVSEGNGGTNGGTDDATDDAFKVELLFKVHMPALALFATAALRRQSAGTDGDVKAAVRECSKALYLHSPFFGVRSKGVAGALAIFLHAFRDMLFGPTDDRGAVVARLCKQALATNLGFWHRHFSPCVEAFELAPTTAMGNIIDISRVIEVCFYQLDEFLKFKGNSAIDAALLMRAAQFQMARTNVADEASHAAFFAVYSLADGSGHLDSPTLPPAVFGRTRNLVEFEAVRRDISHQASLPSCNLLYGKWTCTHSFDELVALANGGNDVVLGQGDPRKASLHVSWTFRSRTQDTTTVLKIASHIAQRYDFVIPGRNFGVSHELFAALTDGLHPACTLLRRPTGEDYEAEGRAFDDAVPTPLLDPAVVATASRVRRRNRDDIGDVTDPRAVAIGEIVDGREHVDRLLRPAHWRGRTRDRPVREVAGEMVGKSSFRKALSEVSNAAGAKFARLLDPAFELEDDEIAEGLVDAFEDSVHVAKLMSLHSDNRANSPPPFKSRGDARVKAMRAYSSLLVQTAAAGWDLLAFLEEHAFGVVVADDDLLWQLLAKVELLDRVSGRLRKGVYVGHGVAVSELMSKALFVGPAWREFDDLAARIARQAKRLANGTSPED